MYQMKWFDLRTYTRAPTDRSFILSMGNTPSKKIEGYGQLDSSHTEEQVLMTPDHRLASSGRSAKQSPWRAVETADRKIYFWNFETGETSWEAPAGIGP